jgi:hypothetical protein
VSRDDEGFLARWSRRKIDARKAPPAQRPPGQTPSGQTAAPPSPPPAAAPAATPGAAPPAPPPAELPALESLTPHSDFSAFMRPGIDPSLKGEALKTLFSDASLYPMDGLDVYIDDYARPDPLPEGWLERLNQFATLHGEPAAEPKTDEEPNEAQHPVSAQVSPDEAATVAAREQECPPEASNTSDTSDPAPESKNRGTS